MNKKNKFQMEVLKNFKILDKKIIFLTLGIFGFSIAYAQIPAEFELYDNVVSNDEITFSMDKLTYYPGDPAYLLGNVTEYRSGLRVTILIMDETGKIRSEISAPVKKNGVFSVQNDIPETVKPGEYTLLIKKGKDGVPVTMKVQIKSITSEIFVTIPFLAQIEDSGINFDPSSTVVEAGQTIVWQNKDDSVHTILSGTKDSNNKMISDGVFDSGIVTPESDFKQILEEGEYQYFCRLHPWLIGSISVSPPSELSSESPPLTSPSVEPPADSTLDIIPKQLNDSSRYSLAEIENFSWEYDLCEFCIGAISLSDEKKSGDSSIHLSVIGNEDSTGPRSTFFLNFDPVDVTPFTSINFWTKTKGNSEDESEKGNQIGLGEFTSNSFPEWTEIKFSLSEIFNNESNFDPKAVKTLAVSMPEGNLMKEKGLSILIDDLYLTKENKKTIETTEPIDELVLETSEPIEEQILAPLKQTNSGVSAENVVCKDGLELIIKSSGGSAACASSHTASALIERGWAI